MASWPCAAATTLMRSVTSPLANATPPGKPSRDAVGRTSSVSEWSFASRATMARPRKPVPPVTSTFIAAPAVSTDRLHRHLLAAPLPEVGDRFGDAAARRPAERAQRLGAAGEQRRVGRPQVALVDGDLHFESRRRAPQVEGLAGPDRL